MPTKKVALIKDWLTSYGGSEEQLYQLHLMYPKAPIYTSVYDAKRLPQFKNADVRTMGVPKWLARGRNFEKLVLLLPHYFKTLQLNEYDVVISVTSGFSKGIRTSENTRHFCICNTPIRFAWNLGGDNRGLMSRLLSPYFRWYDVASSKDVDLFLANSQNVARRIKKIYGRDSQVVYPPVNVSHYQKIVRSSQPEGFVTISRLVSYKRLDLIVEACSQLNVPLTVIGDGPEKAKLMSLAGPNIKFLGFAKQSTIDQSLASAQALIFAAEEDFGIVPVEAMAAGCPVIAYQKGGATETVQEGKSGRFFKKQTVESLKQAITNWQDLPETEIRAAARPFSTERFIEQMRAIVDRV